MGKDDGPCQEGTLTARLSDQEVRTHVEHTRRDRRRAAPATLAGGSRAGPVLDSSTLPAGQRPTFAAFFFGRNPLLVRLSCFDTYRLRNGLVFRHGFLQLREQTEHQPS